MDVTRDIRFGPWNFWTSLKKYSQYRQMMRNESQRWNFKRYNFFHKKKHSRILNEFHNVLLMIHRIFHLKFFFFSFCYVFIQVYSYYSHVAWFSLQNANSTVVLSYYCIKVSFDRESWVKGDFYWIKLIFTSKIVEYCFLKRL